MGSIRFSIFASCHFGLLSIFLFLIADKKTNEQKIFALEMVEMNMQRSLDYSIKNTNFLRTYILNLQKDIQDLRNQHQESETPKPKEEPLPNENFYRLGSSISKHKANLNYMSMIPRLKQEFTKPSLKIENRCFQSELVTKRHSNLYRANQIVKRFESASEAQLTSSEIELSSSRFEPGLHQVNQNLSAEKDFKKTPKTDFQSQEMFQKIEQKKKHELHSGPYCV